jgi:chromosome partitioning protein
MYKGGCMRRVAICNRKGGTAKSTTAVHLAHGLAKTGRRVLLIDTDAQGNCSPMLGVSPETGLADVVDGADPMSAAIEVRDNLYLLAGGRELAGVTREISRRDYDAQLVLSEALKPIDGHFDYAVIDTGPGYSPMSINVLFYASEIVVPISMETLAVYGYLEFLGELEPISKRSGANVRYLLPTMADHRKGLTEDILQQLRDRFPDTVCEPISYAARFSELPRIGETIYENEARNRAAIDYAKFTNKVVLDE